jgi:hypothetical protein
VCYKLTYRSAQEHGKRVDALRRNPAALLALMDDPKAPGTSQLLLAPFLGLVSNPRRLAKMIQRTGEHFTSLWRLPMYWPSDLLKEYRSIAVTTPQGSTTIAVKQYRCRNPAYGGTVDAEEVKDGFLGVSKSAIITEAGGAGPLVNVFVGKGSPEQFATVLALVAKYTNDFVKTYKKHSDTRGQCARMMEGYRDDQWGEMLQAFTDKYLGLDCNGFVGNFVRRTKKSALGPDHYPKEYYEHRKGLRKTVADVSSLDLLVWATFQHIAIIENFEEDDAAKANVYQSTAGGPQNSWHTLVADKAENGLFTLAPASKVGGQFYLVTLDLMK